MTLTLKMNDWKSSHFLDRHRVAGSYNRKSHLGDPEEKTETKRLTSPDPLEALVPGAQLHGTW
jgi:hypothetical protein